MNIPVFRFGGGAAAIAGTTVTVRNTTGTNTTFNAGVQTAIPNTTIVLPASSLPWELSAAVTLEATSAPAAGFEAVLFIVETSNGVDTAVTLSNYCKAPATSNSDAVTLHLPREYGYLGPTSRTRYFSLAVETVGFSARLMSQASIAGVYGGSVLRAAA